MNGADKPMLKLAGKTLMEHVIEQAAPQVDALLINANGNIARFAALGREVVMDAVGDYPGPLAGILAGFEWTQHNHPGAGWLISFACDCPFMPSDLVNRLVSAAKTSGVAVATAASGGQRHPVFSAWSMDLPLDTEDVLRTRRLRKVDDLIAAFPNTVVEFDAIPFDPFFNINTPDELHRAEQLATESKAHG